MNTALPKLKKGDTIALVSPAKAIDSVLIEQAKMRFEAAGFHVLIGKNAAGNSHYFSGTDLERASDFQWALDHPDVKAIICNRGGYGCIRILDRINWAGMLREPKWIVGFSDVTVFHQKMQTLELPSIHATMPLNFNENSPESIESLLLALQEHTFHYQLTPQKNNKFGTASGILLGGNLSILHSLIGTEIQPNYANSILYIEDVGEQLYAIDRMLFAFEKAGILNQINGLIVGGMTDLKDTATPIGMTLEELILEKFAYRSIPIVFGFPAGHVNDNRALILGKEVKLEVSLERTCVSSL